MKIIALYHPESDHARIVDEFVRSLKSRLGVEVELMSLETVEGANKAQAYSIVDYPALIVTTDDGVIQKIWEGSQMPLIDEVTSYLIA